MKSLTSLMTTAALALFSFLFLQCQSDEAIPAATDDPTLETTQNPEFLTIEYDAADLINALTADPAVFTGVMVRVQGAQLEFEKVGIEGQKYVSTGIEVRPPGKPEINFGSVQRTVTQQDRFQFWQGNFDLAYFPWQDVKMICDNSEKIYFSGVEVFFGKSWHANFAADQIQNSRNFSLKLEGDFSNGLPQNEAGNNVPQPMYVLGKSCPPIWLP